MNQQDELELVKDKEKDTVVLLLTPDSPNISTTTLDFDDTSIILPCCPSDEEKLLYLKANTTPLISYLLFSFVTMMCGMWLFTISYPAFFVFAFLNLYFMFYLVLSYTTGIMGPDYDYNNHVDLVEAGLTNFPSVDIYLPVCGEPLEVLNNTWMYVMNLDYPNLKIWVLDDSANQSVKQLALNFKFNYIVRANRPELKKSGNLRNAFLRTKGDFYIIFDADFCPRPEMVREMMVHMVKYPNVAILQTPQFFRIRPNQTWIEQSAGLVQELFYRVIQSKRDRYGASICVGTSAMYRRKALEPFGGSAAIEHSEDVHTGVQCLQDGWDIKYLPLNYSMGICPDDLASFFNQQYRWASGSLTLLSNKEFWKSSLTTTQKVCYLSGMLYYIASSLDPFISTLPSLVLVIFRPDMIKWYNSVFIIPSLFVTTVAYYFWTCHDYTPSILKIQMVQSYSHIFAIKDKIFSTSANWIPTGGQSKVKNRRFEQSKVLCFVVNWVTYFVLCMLIIWRCFEYSFWEFIPTILIGSIQLYATCEFIFYDI
ncbi:nucleotide-diphospho-sugar transferase [Globomyces pollinis-pini]|nr:nucleotide-diphospho-sugar transferase [Globomyces pollinis-pini]